MRTVRAFLIFIILLVFSRNEAFCAELISSPVERAEVQITVYPDNLALVNDRRSLELTSGENQIVFQGISRQIRPETITFAGKGLRVLEQGVEYDLLSPQSLLARYVGKEVVYVTTNPVTGEAQREQATVLSAGSGVVLARADHVITDISRGYLQFPHIPAGLRTEPTLVMVIRAGEGGEQEAELTYLTAGISWKADYVAVINESDHTLSLDGWATVVNSSGTAFDDAALRLVAGTVNVVSTQPLAGAKMAVAALAAEAAPAVSGAARQALSDYHLFAIDRKTSLADKQQKQVRLFSAAGVQYGRKYVLRGEPHHYRPGYGQTASDQRVAVLIHLVNERPSGLGMPLPEGIIRVYSRDRSGGLRFLGEDLLAHTPQGGAVELMVGKAFDLEVEKRQTDFKKISGREGLEGYESAYEITLQNRKTEPVSVWIEEPVAGDWEILEESLPHSRKDAHLVVWQLMVPAGGSQKLGYRVRVAQ